MAQNLWILEETAPRSVLHAPTSSKPLLPFQFLITTYDVAIAACDRSDRAKAKAAIVDLMAAFNLPHTRSASRFFLLYEFCLERLTAGAFQEVREILIVLRESWLNFSDFEHAPAGRA